MEYNPNQEPHYGAEEIQVLEGLGSRQKAPGHVYRFDRSEGTASPGIRDRGQRNRRRQLAGYCDRIDVEILPQNVIRVVDNGRGIPTGIHPKEGISRGNRRL